MSGALLLRGLVAHDLETRNLFLTPFFEVTT